MSKKYDPIGDIFDIETEIYNSKIRRDNWFYDEYKIHESAGMDIEDLGDLYIVSEDLPINI